MLKQHSTIPLTRAHCFTSVPLHSISAWLPEVGTAFTDVSQIAPLWVPSMETFYGDFSPAGRMGGISSKWLESSGTAAEGCLAGWLEPLLIQPWKGRVHVFLFYLFL